MNRYLDWPGVQQVFRLTRERTVHGKTSVEVAFGVTSLPTDKADAAHLLKLVRGHWGIENSLFYVRDVTMNEDHCRVRTGHAAALLADLRNIVVALLEATDWTNKAAAIRHFTAHPEEAIAIIEAFP